MSAAGGCGCDPAAAVEPSTANPAGQPALRRRVAVHATSLARMRASLGAPDRPLELRALARQGTDDPVVALLDTWAVVADVVAFYSERLAQEGFLRTATELQSVRELARTLGYELRPGVAAQVELAFSAHVVAGSPEVVTVPRGTPVQSIPGQDELPQVFETVDDLEVRGVWNEIPGSAAGPQPFGFGVDRIWLAGGTTSVRPGDAVLVVGAERRRYGLRSPARRPPGTERDGERWDFRTVTEVVTEPDGLAGWTLLLLDEPIGYRRSDPLVAERDVSVHAFAERTTLFGANAPDPNLLVIDGEPPAGAVRDGPGSTTYRWRDFGVLSQDEPHVIEVDGDRKGLLPDTWLVLDQPGWTEAYRVETATPDGASKFALSGRLTRARLDIAENLRNFDRRRALVHCSSTPLPADQAPLADPVGGATLVLTATDPPLPPDRLVVVTGTDAVTGEPAAEAVTVLSCAPDAGGATMTATLEPALARSYLPATLRVRGNVGTASHGETVEQVLGSGDGRQAFPQFRPRRAPLTHVRAQTPSGASAELAVRVDGMQWAEVPSLDAAGPHDRVYALRHDEDGAVRIVAGDGTHGARVPTGAENVTATYRVGIGEPGAVGAGQVSLLARRPLGIREVTNPAAAHDWAPAETLDEARVNAPLRVRTLDRAVSVADHEDFARGYAGVGPARGDLVWDGRASLVVVTLLGTGALPVSDALLGDLRAALDAARDPGTALRLEHGQILWFGVRVEITRDPTYLPEAVDAAVVAALEAAFAPATRAFAAPVTAAAALVVVRAVPGVLACSMPRLLPLPGPGRPGVPPVLPADHARLDPFTALPARWARGTVRPAQLAALAAGGVALGSMTR